MIAFVTGASGFLGQSLVRQLIKDGAEVRCLVRTASKARSLTETLPKGAEQRIKIVLGSIDRAESLRESLNGVDVVYHLAAAMRGATAVLFLKNVVGSRELVRACGQARVGRFVLVSSIAVYETYPLRDFDTVDEACAIESQAHRRDPYTYSKVAEELAVKEEAVAAGVPLTVVRPGVIYGPGRGCLSARVGLQFGSFLLRMGGRQELCYTYVDNCAQAIALAGRSPAAAGETFNIIDDSPPTARSLFKQYRKIVGGMRSISVPHWAITPLSRLCQWYHGASRGQLPAVFTPYKSGSLWKRLHYSNDKAKRILHWSPAVSFQEGLRRSFEWHNSQCDKQAAT